MALLKQGDRLKDRYQIERVIGQGAMGTVYLARDEARNGATWALKVLDEAELQPARVAEAVSLFRREADITTRLRHPGLPDVVDFFSEQGRHVLVMVAVAGETLEQIAARRGGIVDEATLLPLLLQLCACLAYLHSQRPHPIVYRDLKPSNCMVTPSGRLVLIDFGIARHCKPGRKADTIVFGTPGFCAPEQYGRGQTEPRSDLFSFGAMTWHLLTGLDPASVAPLFPPVRTVAPYVSEALGAVVTRCLQLRPDDRYPSATALLEALREAVHRPVRGTATPAARAIDRALLASWARRSFRVWWGAGSIHASRILGALCAVLVLGPMARLGVDPPLAERVPVRRLGALQRPTGFAPPATRVRPSTRAAGLDARHAPATRAPSAHPSTPQARTRWR